ncbi:MAG: hypothetical protein AMJ89_02760 [candidate division Zixibacteria bacterium SM23_73]|nr:MAG: hypothetical protein AMJ89_02760 [candidate division Zixibacteria bacterium SM23_73]
MNCRKVRRCLFSYFKNELSEEEKAEIKLHLEGCPDCAKEALEVERVTSLVRNSLETLTPSPDFNQKLLSQVQKLSSEKVREVRRASFSPLRIKWALAGSFMAIILVSVLWFTHKRTPISPEPISEESRGTESLQLVNKEGREDSMYQEILNRLMNESQFATKTFVLDNFRSVGTRGIDGMEKLEDLHKRFIIETAGYGAERRRMENHYVLPVVSTQQASEKVNY